MKNEFGIEYTEFVCEACGNTFTVTPKPKKDWRDCLSVECPSYGTKTVKLSNRTHKLLREYCKEEHIKMSAWVDAVILSKVLWRLELLASVPQTGSGNVGEDN